jgi:hypothetical protein
VLEIFTNFILNLPVSVDLLIIDEIESLLDSMVSPTMQTPCCREALVAVIRNARQVIAMQAELSDHTYDFIFPNRRRACKSGVLRLLWRIAPSNISKHVLEIPTERQWARGLQESLAKGERIVILADSKSKVRELHKWITSPGPDGCGVDANEVYIYTSDSTPSAKNDIVNCENVWITSRIVMYSPTITYGVDFNPSESYFDAVFAHASGNSVSVKTFSQMMNRIRVPKQRLIWLYLNAPIHGTIPKDTPMNVNAVITMVLGRHLRDPSTVIRTASDALANPALVAICGAPMTRLVHRIIRDNRESGYRFATDLRSQVLLCDYTMEAVERPTDLEKKRQAPVGSFGRGSKKRKEEVVEDRVNEIMDPTRHDLEPIRESLGTELSSQVVQVSGIIEHNTKPVYIYNIRMLLKPDPTLVAFEDEYQVTKMGVLGVDALSSSLDRGYLYAYRDFLRTVIPDYEVSALFEPTILCKYSPKVAPSPKGMSELAFSGIPDTMFRSALISLGGENREYVIHTTNNRPCPLLAYHFGFTVGTKSTTFRWLKSPVQTVGFMTSLLNAISRKVTGFKILVWEEAGNVFLQYGPPERVKVVLDYINKANKTCFVFLVLPHVICYKR